MTLRRPRLRIRTASLLDDDFGIIESEDESLAASESDICRCGATRRDHDGPEGLIEQGKCRKFREML